MNYNVSQGHPLDQLSAQEITRAAALCKSYAAKHNVGELRFNTITLQEPAKAALLAYASGVRPAAPRQALCVLIVPTRESALEAIIELSSKGSDADSVVSWKELPGLHPMTTPDDNFYCEAVVKRDGRVAELLRTRYGVTDMSQLICDTWACHGAPDHLNHKRLMQGFLYLKLSPNDNEYAHPLDMVPIVDLNAGEVVHIDMYDRPPPVPMGSSNYHRDLQQLPWRQDIKPLHVVQPEGPSFSVEGNLVRWQKWELRLGFNAREGLVLHDVAYHDAGVRRPVLHRASLVEMAVPYGDPSYPYIRKCAFDVGDYGFGFCANSLALGCDCLGHIRYFDAVLNTSSGAPLLLPQAVCLHEEDAGILWKHWDCRTGAAEVRRSRRLVVSMVSTFMNYEYALYWYLYQDGSINFELKLTGILSTSAAPLGEELPPFGVRVAPGVNATVHQHFFCMRIDAAIDDARGGKDLVVSEVESKQLPIGPQNPHANAFLMAETELATTHQAQRRHNFDTARCWRIKNPFSINPISKLPVSYRLLPAASPAMMAQSPSLVARRAVFATKHLWVTPHSDQQKYPAGEHVVQSDRCLGLAEWTRKDEPLAGRDPVIWYSFGVTHAPRVEDFPVMPCEVVGFSLKPDGFFIGNPAVDLPPERDVASKLDGGQKGEAAGQQSCCVAKSKL